MNKPMTPNAPGTPAIKTGTARARQAPLTRTPTAEERRRSQRVLVRMPVTIHVGGKQLTGNTHTVSAGGAMVIIKEGLPEGTKVVVENPATKMKVDAKVVRPPQMNQEGSMVPVEFVTPSPTFWNIFFPPFTN
jgi:PilZ domain